MGRVGRDPRLGAIHLRHDVVIIMDDERRRAILDEARETLERLADFEVENREHNPRDPLLRSRPPSEPVRRERPLDTRPTTSGEEHDWSGWESWLAARLATERQLVLDAVGEAIGQLLEGERKATTVLANELHDVKLEAAKLGNEVATLREALAVERAAVLDLPSPLSRRVVN